MADIFSLEPIKMQTLISVRELRECSDLTARFGLCLSEEQIQNVVAHRFEALKNTGRIEFGEGILKKLVYAFCDSPYITQKNFAETLIDLQDAFYYFKNQSDNSITDDELIDYMELAFNENAQGSTEYLLGTSLEDLCRDTGAGR
ncbi:MAG: DUF6323 family protein [Oscillospiraceae bacterium]